MVVTDDTNDIVIFHDRAVGIHKHVCHYQIKKIKYFRDDEGNLELSVVLFICASCPMILGNFPY